MRAAAVRTLSSRNFEIFFFIFQSVGAQNLCEFHKGFEFFFFCTETDLNWIDWKKSFGICLFIINSFWTKIYSETICYPFNRSFHIYYPSLNSIIALDFSPVDKMLSQTCSQVMTSDTSFTPKVQDEMWCSSCGPSKFDDFFNLTSDHFIMMKFHPWILNQRPLVSAMLYHLAREMGQLASSVATILLRHPSRQC